MLISSCFLEKGTVITPLLLFYLDLGLVCKKKFCFVQYTLKKCLNNFVQSAVEATRNGGENPTPSGAAETTKLLANSSYGNQIMNGSPNTVTKYLGDKKADGAIRNNMFKCLTFINDQLYEVELIMSEIEHQEPIIVGFFILQCAKLGLLVLYYKFFDKNCVVTKIGELEMDTDGYIYYYPSTICMIVSN